MRFTKWNRGQILEWSLVVGLVLTLVFCCRVSAFAQTASTVREDTLRLHIRANSDSEQDQSLKLKVRDAILKESPRLFGESPDKETALLAAAASLPEIQRIAEQTLAQHDCFLPVKVYLTRMPFDTTAYTGFTLPAGEYDALRVDIGAHEGKNWFCVLYPGLCLPAVEGEQLYPEQDQQELVEKGPEVRFAFLEWWESWHQKHGKA